MSRLSELAAIASEAGQKAKSAQWMADWLGRQEGYDNSGYLASALLHQELSDAAREGLGHYLRGEQVIIHRRG